MGLARNRTKPSHLPEQPLVGLNPRWHTGKTEFFRPAAEIFKDTPDSKFEIGFQPGPLGSTMAGIRLIAAIFNSDRLNGSPIPIFTGRTA